MSDVNLSISKEVVQPIIEAKVNAAVCEALGGSKDIVSDVVARVLNQRVDNKGKPSNYSCDKDTYVQWLCSEAIRKAATEAIKEFINSKNDVIVKEIKAAMNRKSKSIAVNLVNSFIETVKSDYRLKVDVSATVPERSY